MQAGEAGTVSRYTVPHSLYSGPNTDNPQFSRVRLAGGLSPPCSPVCPLANILRHRTHAEQWLSFE